MFSGKRGAGKDHTSFAEMLAALRIDSLTQFKKNIFQHPGFQRGIINSLNPWNT